MKIIFLSRIAFIRQHLVDLYVEPISQKYSIEMWDISAIYNRTEVMSDSIENVMKFSTLQEFDHALAALNGNALIITNIMFYHLKKINPTIKKNNLDLVNITKEGLTSHLFYRGIKNIRYGGNIKAVARCFLENIGIFRRLFNRIVNGHARYDYLLATNNFYPEYTHYFVKTHHIKYDEYLSNQSSPMPFNERYAVFLDSGVTSHPMFNSTSHNNIDSAQYLDQLNRFFDALENQLKIKVIISAHPKSEFITGAFGNRPIIKYKTPLLIQHSDLVISHYSTSVINAILAKKPLIFLYSRQMFKSAQKYIAFGGLEFARELKAPVYNLEDNHVVPIRIDPIAYDRFIERYIVDPDRRQQNNADIILQFLNQYELANTQKS